MRHAKNKDNLRLSLLDQVQIGMGIGVAAAVKIDMRGNEAADGQTITRVQPGLLTRATFAAKLLRKERPELVWLLRIGFPGEIGRTHRRGEERLFDLPA